MCKEHSMKHIEDAMYREHEIVIMQCNNCDLFVIDARSDDFDGPMLAGYIDNSIFSALTKAIKSVDKHEVDKLILVNVPF